VDFNDKKIGRLLLNKVSARNKTAMNVVKPVHECTSERHYRHANS